MNEQPNRGEDARLLGKMETAGNRNTEIDRLRFSERLLHSPFLYRVYETEADQEIIKVWKRMVDSIIQETKQFLEQRFPSYKREARVRLALGDHPTEKDIVLYSIARFIHLQRKSNRCFIPSALLQFLPGGKHTLSEFGKKDEEGRKRKMKGLDNCITTSVVAEVLAEQYGYHGTIAQPEGEEHRYWQHSGGNREIIDTFWLQDRDGYLREPTSYGQVCRKED